MPTIKYIALFDAYSESKEVCVHVDVSESEMKSINNPVTVSIVVPRAHKKVLKEYGTQWMCFACHSCLATRMVSSPALHPHSPEGPVLVDYTPFPICENPQCNAKASRAAHDLREQISGAIPSLGESEAERCDNCKKIQKVKESGGMKRCGGCRAKLYCCKECQIQHWKRGHKHVCARNDKK